MKSYPRELFPFQSKWININGNNIHHIDEGKGKTILFCHPSVTSSFMYRNLIKELSKNFRCVALDFPDFGLSEATKEYQHSIASQSEIIDGLLKHLQLIDLYLLMQEVGGHSAMKVFIKQPELLKGIIITDTIIFPCSSYPKIRTMLNFVNSGVFNFINMNLNFLARGMTKFGIQKRKLTEQERSVYKQLFDTKTKRRNMTFLLHELVTQDQLLIDIQRQLETTFNKIPALIIYGDKDPLAEMKIPQRTYELLPNSELHWIKGEAHFPHEGTPDEMSAIITNWLTETN
jgi:haloalkane dehalogenase